MLRRPGRCIPVHGLSAAVLAGFVGCAGETGEPPEAAAGTPIAWIGERALTDRSFRAYLVSQFGSEEDIQGGDELLSRLLDQFLDEQILLGQAEEAGLGVEAEEVERFLEAASPRIEAGEPGEREEFVRQVRGTLLTRKWKDRILAERVQVAPAEVEEYFRSHPERFHRPGVVHLRQILVDDRDQAERIRRQLGADPARFQDVAEIHSVAPDKGLTSSHEEADLPVEIREAVTRLQPGEITDVLQDSQGYHIFQLVDREQEQGADLAAVRGAIEATLFREKSERALREHLGESRSRIAVRVDAASLPFRYVEEGG
ncbi:MAG: peptidyl-prolyl cis-trans isomerase [Acidobacteria bacterium]|nr:peptidyl-prolyl cis-trans isomerase [Acidobacteriota bacterium]